VYETDMAEGLKAMALEGHGIAFLPMSAVKKDVRAKKLVSAAPPELKDLQITMEIRRARRSPRQQGGLRDLWQNVAVVGGDQALPQADQAGRIQLAQGLAGDAPPSCCAGRCRGRARCQTRSDAVPQQLVNKLL
jgi:DNA-binding transcriptional LysR family regulator